MQLIGMSERRYFGRGTRLAAIFLKPDGFEFELPVSVDQMSELIAQSGEVNTSPQRSSARPPSRSPAPRSPTAPQSQPTEVPIHEALSDDAGEFEGDEGTIRLARINDDFGGGFADDDDDDSL